MSSFPVLRVLCARSAALDEADADLRAISTRAEISPTRFSNEYHWGNLRADPAKLVERYFDAHLYVASWGTRRLMLRLPEARVDVKELKVYFPRGYAARLKAGKHVVLDLTSDVEDGEYEERPESLAALAPPFASLVTRLDSIKPHRKRRPRACAAAAATLARPARAARRRRPARASGGRLEWPHERGESGRTAASQ